MRLKKVKCITVVTGPLNGYNHTAYHLNTIKISYCHVRIRNNLIRFPVYQGNKVNFAIAR